MTAVAVSAVCWLAGITPAPAETPCRAPIAAVENALHIPEGFLAAIGAVESGSFTAPGSRAEPWPWTINAAGTGHRYASAQEAVTAARGFMAAGITSLDAGCLQVSLLYHKEAFATLEQAFDPGANARAAGAILAALYRETGSWPRAAAAYHSRTPELGSAYAAKVLAAWTLPEAAKGSSPAPVLLAAADPRLPFRARDGGPAEEAPPQETLFTPKAAALAGKPFGGAHANLPAATALAIPIATGRGLSAYRAFPVRRNTVASSRILAHLR